MRNRRGVDARAPSPASIGFHVCPRRGHGSPGDLDHIEIPGSGSRRAEIWTWRNRGLRRNVVVELDDQGWPLKRPARGNRIRTRPGELTGRLGGRVGFAQQVVCAASGRLYEGAPSHRPRNGTRSRGTYRDPWPLPRLACGGAPV